MLLFYQYHFCIDWWVIIIYSGMCFLFNFMLMYVSSQLVLMFFGVYSFGLEKFLILDLFVGLGV